MAKNITLCGASYSNVPAVELPQTGGGTARFDDVSGTTATNSDVISGKVFVKADGSAGSGSLVIQHYYTGSSVPSASLGVNGDIYLKT